MKSYFVIGWAVCLMLFWGNCSKTDIPKICWKLPNGDTAVFSHKESSFFESDHAKRLMIIDRFRRSENYEFAASHSGYEHVELRIDQKNEVIWIVDKDSRCIGFSLNIKTNSFIDENGQHPEGVTATTGHILPPLAYPLSEGRD